MGQLPEEMQTLCARLFKLSDGLRGLAEGLLNDLSEKTGQYDVVRLQRTLLQMNRAFGWFEGINKLWRLASMEQASGAPVSKWVSRELREGQPHLFFHCAGIRVSEQLEKLLWRKVGDRPVLEACLLYTSPSPRDRTRSRMPSSA